MNKLHSIIDIIGQFVAQKEEPKEVMTFDLCQLLISLQQTGRKVTSFIVLCTKFSRFNQSSTKPRPTYV